MKKVRITCREWCPIWNSEDRDCEIYGVDHLSPRTCPHYNGEDFTNYQSKKGNT